MAKDMPKHVEFGLCGLDVTVEPKELADLFKVPPGCLLQPVAAFQLAYQGYPWEPTKAYAKGSALTERRYPNGATYPAWFEIDEMIRWMPEDTKISFHLNDTSACGYCSSFLEGAEEGRRLLKVMCEEYKARHIQVNISSRDVRPELFMPGPCWEKSAEQVVEAAERYPQTIFIIPIFQRKEKGLSSLPFFEKILSSCRSRNILAFFDNSSGEGKEPSDVPEIPADYRMEAVGFTGGIKPGNVKEWLTRYHQKASEAGCWVVCDAQSGFRKKGQRSEEIDLDELRKLTQAAYEWGASQPSEIKPSAKEGY